LGGKIKKFSLPTQKLLSKHIPCRRQFLSNT
jgi:hypothetical protein